ncbi:MAG TPA: carboxypeptidase-like regulatory domain-containing protein [Candidatus Angelobacter sp.]
MRLTKSVAVAAIILAAALAHPQGRGAQGARTLSGHVISSANQPLQGAVVYLKNAKTLAIKTYISEPDGSYRFSALSPNVDYEIYADYQGAHSDTKTLSAFDNRKQVEITLRIRGK